MQLHIGSYKVTSLLKNIKKPLQDGIFLKILCWGFIKELRLVSVLLDPKAFSNLPC